MSPYRQSAPRPIEQPPRRGRHKDIQVGDVWETDYYRPSEEGDEKWTVLAVKQKKAKPNWLDRKIYGRYASLLVTDPEIETRDTQGRKMTLHIGVFDSMRLVSRQRSPEHTRTR